LSNNTSDIGHRFLWIIMEDKILFIEPQIDEIYRVDELYDILELNSSSTNYSYITLATDTLCYYLDDVDDVNELI